MASYSESFDKANSTTLGPDLTWVELQGDLQVLGNAADVVSSATTWCLASAAHDLSGGDQQVTATKTGVTGTGTNVRTGVILRSNQASSSGYLCWIAHDGTAGILKLSGGSPSSVASGSVTLGASPNTVVGEIQGSVIRLYYNGVLVCSYTDPSPLSSSYTRTGFGVMSDSGTGLASVASWQAADLVASATGTAAVTGPSPAGAGTGTVLVKGTSAVTGPSPSGSGTGVTGMGTATGTAAVTGPSPTALATGTVPVAGTAESVGPSPAAAGDGTVLVQGTAAVDGPSPTGGGVGITGIPGSGAVTGPSPTVAGTGTVLAAGAAAVAGPSPAAAGTGTVLVRGSAAVVGPSPAVRSDYLVLTGPHGSGVRWLWATAAIRVEVSPPGGVLRAVVGGAEPPTAEQVRSGLDGSGRVAAAVRGRVAEAGPQSFLVTGLAPGPYHAHFVYTDPTGLDSQTVTSKPFEVHR